MESYIYYVFVLNILFGKFFGPHYPREIIKLIMLFSYRPIQVSAGWCRTILYGAKTYVWGNNRNLQLGLGDNKDRNSPQELLLKNIKSINCGEDHIIAITKSGKCYVWGYSYWGALGLSNIDCAPTPYELELRDIKLINCGARHTIAVTNINVVYVWGYNYHGSRVVPSGNNLECFPPGNTIGIRR